MKLFTATQIKDIDRFTVINEPISPVDLIERAAGALSAWYVSHFDRNRKVIVSAGPGNNGGDGLAMARILCGAGYKVEVNCIKFTEKNTPEWEDNFRKIKGNPQITVNIIRSADEFSVPEKDDVVIDALFGTGISRKIEGLPRDVIMKINGSDAVKVAVDIPSGLFCEDNAGNDREAIIRADHTLALQFPKLAFMFAENARFVGKWEIIPIGLSNEAIHNTPTPFYFTGAADVLPLLRKRRTFDHKGSYGHGLLAAGSKGKMGAATLAAAAALRTGMGLITVHTPLCGLNIMQTALPEAMVACDKSAEHISFINAAEGIFSAAALGPGIGVHEETMIATVDFLMNYRKPAVLDADALNILAMNREWLAMLRSNIVITPHVKEFDRLAGISKNGFLRYRMQMEFAQRYNCTVVLKGAYTSVATPGGRVMFNSSGNNGMATAGSGDVLTGIILSLLAQGYTAENAAVAGVFIHGLAGDIAAEKKCCESLIASDIINNIAPAYKRIRQGTDENT
ncbi:MAG: NAD(P)H-hydrate dehydratase [Bacteroidales bacterium]|jgi:NAD(P)H-hydrate epimerase|nr:NAD(P)H-hydrate dehydratase [Bacteroidales bacterium]